MSDPQGRRSVGDLVADRPERLFHVGRLDTDTEGLLLLTNDGELAHRLAHPSHEVSKTYVAEVEGRVRPATRRLLLDGVELDDGPVACDAVTVLDTVPVQGAPRTLVEVALHQGRNRVVRRMFDAVGHPVRRLTRTALAGVRVGTLRTGQLRELTADELGPLLDLVGL
jgi:23S rRNA pseudouridine2605 synthase